MRLGHGAHRPDLGDPQVMPASYAAGKPVERREPLPASLAYRVGARCFCVCSLQLKFKRFAGRRDEVRYL